MRLRGFTIDVPRRSAAPPSKGDFRSLFQSLDGSLDKEQTSSGNESFPPYPPAGGGDLLMNAAICGGRTLPAGGGDFSLLAGRVKGGVKRRGMFASVAKRQDALGDMKR